MSSYALKILQYQLVMGHIFGCDARSCAFYYGNGSPDPSLCAPLLFCMVSKLFFNFLPNFDRPSLRPRKCFPYYYLLIALVGHGSQLSGWLILKLSLPQSWSAALSIYIFFCWGNYFHHLSISLLDVNRGGGHGEPGQSTARYGLVDSSHDVIHQYTHVLSHVSLMHSASCENSSSFFSI